MKVAVKNRVLAVITAVAVLLSLVGCGYDTRNAATWNSESATAYSEAAGVYIMCQFFAVGDARNLLVETYPDVDTNDKDFDETAYDLEGAPFLEWVDNRAMDLWLDFFAVEDKFAALGLSFTDEELLEQAEMVNLSWDSDRGPAEKWGKFFEKRGVSKESFALVQVNSEKRVALFEAIYGEDGTNPVSEKEWQTAFEEKYARVRVLDLADPTNSDGSELNKQQKEMLDEFKQVLFQRIVDGESFTVQRMAYNSLVEDITHECDESVDCESCERLADFGKDSDDDDDEDDDDEDDDNDEDEDDSDDEDEDKDDDDEDFDDDDFEFFDIYEQLDRENDEYVYLDSDLDSDLLDFVKSLKVGDVKMYSNVMENPHTGEESEVTMVVARLDTLGDESVHEKYREIIITELKSEEFDDMIRAHGRAMRDSGVLIINDKAIDRYHAKKFLDR